MGLKVLVVGSGKVGYYLAKTLQEHGHHPVLIEKDKELAKKTANDLDVRVFYGDGTTIDMLESVHCGDMDAFISVTGNDEANLVACQLAKRMFNVPRTVARVNNPKNAVIMKKLGVDIPVSSTDHLARLIEREVDTTSIRQLMAINRGSASISEVTLPDDYPQSGIRLHELKLPEESIIVSITRGETIIIPRGNTQLLSGDKVIVVCHNKVLHELAQILQVDKLK